MSKKRPDAKHKLKLERETLRTIDAADLPQAAGGGPVVGQITTVLPVTTRRTTGGER